MMTGECILDSRLRGNDGKNTQKCVIPAKAGIQENLDKLVRAVQVLAETALIETMNSSGDT